jgi:hypothetical protein
MITHVVLFRLKDRSPENIEDAQSRLRGLAGKVPSLRHLEVGRNVIHSERSYDLALIARFNDLEGLEAYQVHPEHVPIASHMRTISESIVAVDFESGQQAHDPTVN